MDEDLLVERIRARAGLASATDAQRVLTLSLSTLSEALDDLAARNLASELPEGLAQLVHGRTWPKVRSADELFKKFSAREGTERGFAMEHLQVVCQELGRQLSDSALALLRSHLPPDIAALFAPPDAYDGPPDSATKASGRMLATARPGTSRPLSEAGPELAHAHSVAREQNPHGETKLSSSQGMTQERLDDTLAAGQPRRGP